MQMEQFQEHIEGESIHTLRQATEADAELLFRLQHLDGGDIDISDVQQSAKVEKYKADFNPDKIQVIEYKGLPVGRLRVVRGDTIYIGGLQILPECRGKGIGTSVIENLIQESRETSLPIMLEVRHNNPQATDLYSKLGFETIDQDEIQKIMRYHPQTKTSQ